MIAFGMLAFLILCALFGPALVPYDPLASSDRILQPPSGAHWFGTDHLGRDVFSRVIVATRLDMAISIGAVALSFVAGAILGCAAGYWGGWPDAVISRGLDMIMAFPLFVLAMPFLPPSQSRRDRGGAGRQGRARRPPGASHGAAGGATRTPRRRPRV